jgi:hypothetical protein
MAAFGPDRKRRKTHVFRIVLSHSWKADSEATFRQTTEEDFIRCLENAFWHFGGMTETFVIDYLRAAVKHPDWFVQSLPPDGQALDITAPRQGTRPAGVLSMTVAASNVSISTA